jgi:hypothetical protein
LENHHHHQPQNQSMMTMMTSTSTQEVLEELDEPPIEGYYGYVKTKDSWISKMYSRTEMQTLTELITAADNLQLGLLLSLLQVTRDQRTKLGST